MDVFEAAIFKRAKTSQKKMLKEKEEEDMVSRLKLLKDFIGGNTKHEMR